MCQVINEFSVLYLFDRGRLRYNVLMESKEKKPLNPKADEVKESFLPIELINDVVTFYKMMGDPTRLYIMMALSNNEFCVSDLAYILNLSQPAVSHALGLLRNQKLVKTRREGKIIFYSLDDEHVATVLDMAIAHISERYG